MDVKEIKTLSPSEAAAHWYYISKGRAMRDMLGPEPVRRVLDIGAGSAIFSRQLLEVGLTREAICIDPAYDSEHEEAARDNGHIHFRRSADGATAPLVLMMDVLEHVENDLGLVRQHMDIAKPGTRLMVTVPAFRALWSSHDVYLEHFRRYRLHEVETLLESAGLDVIGGRYFFGAIFPGVAALRLAFRLRRGAGPPKASDMTTTPGPVNRALIALHDIERRVMFPLNRLAGVSVFALAIKP